MGKYNIIIFKNKKKKKILKEYETLVNAKSYYEKILAKSKEILFDIKFENGLNVSYELALVETDSFQKDPIYSTDEFGRNFKVVFEDKTLNVISVSQFKKEEKIFDIQDNKRITIDQFIKKYLKLKDVKIVSLINNKIIVQVNEKFNLFTLKSEEDSMRFINCVSKIFFTEKRKDCMFVTDVSSPQKKYLLSLLESEGFDKKILYRQYTTFPRSK
jgi:hypothetical protein